MTYLYGEDAEEHEVDGAEFIKAGNYTLVVTGIGNYEGSGGRADFTIEDRNDNSDNGNNGNNDNNNGNNSGNNGNNGNAGKNNSANNTQTTAAKTTAAKTSAQAETPKTGDSSNMILWISLIVISYGAIVGTALGRRKRR